jgi:hypothetical protein
MMVAQSIRHSKTSGEVVNEKREGRDFNGTYWMLGKDSKEARDKEVSSQDSGVRSQESGARSQK